VRSGSRGAAALRLSLFLPANIPTSMHITTAIVEANVLPASRIAGPVSSHPRRVFSVGYELTTPHHGDVHESPLQNSFSGTQRLSGRNVRPSAGKGSFWSGPLD